MRCGLCLLGLFAFSWGCASGPEIPLGTVWLTKADHARFSASAAENDALRARLSGLEGQLVQLKKKVKLLHVRTALLSYRPDRITPMPGGPQPAELADVTTVATRGDRAKKRNLKKFVASTKGVVFSFWATWCVPCISDEELAHLRELRKQLARYDVAVIPMAVDDLERVLAHPKAAQWLYPLYFKKSGHIDLLPQRFIETAGMGLPLFVVVSNRGDIHYVYQKSLDDELVVEMVHAALSLPVAF